MSPPVSFRIHVNTLRPSLDLALALALALTLAHDLRYFFLPPFILAPLFFKGYNTTRQLNFVIGNLLFYKLPRDEQSFLSKVKEDVSAAHAAHVGTSF